MYKDSALIMTVSAMTALAAATYVAPKNDNVGIFRNEIRKLNETPVCTAGMDSRLAVLESKADKYRVKTADGCEGWVEKRLVGAFGASRQIIYDAAEVQAELDNVRPLMVWGRPNSPDADIVPITRSFAEALRDNADRETVERQVE